jgi:hypothetical protein
MSGDYNTGMGNCLLVAAMTEEWLTSLGVKFDYFADSDDCLVFCERKDLSTLLSTVSDSFLEYGQETVIENIAYEFKDIRHCQSAPMFLGGRYRMVRDWAKVLSQAFSGYNHYHEPRGGMRVMKSVAQCELVLNAGVPILQPLSLKMLAILESVRFAKLDERDTVAWLAMQEAKRRHFDWTTMVSEPITSETRLEFERVFGLTPEQQLSWEAWISRLSFAEVDLSKTREDVPFVDQHYY